MWESDTNPRRAKSPPATAIGTGKATYRLINFARGPSISTYFDITAWHARQILHHGRCRARRQ